MLAALCAMVDFIFALLPFALIFGALIAIYLLFKSPARKESLEDAVVNVSSTGSKIDVKCLVCEGASFRESQVQMNTPLLTFLNLDWANSRAWAIECQGCGFIMWFKSQPKLRSEA